MQGLRRTSDNTRQVTERRPQLTLNKRGVQIIGSGAPQTATKGAKTSAAAATRSTAAAHRVSEARTAMSDERQMDEQAADTLRQAYTRASTSTAKHTGKAAARGTAKVVRGGANLAGKAVKGGVVAAQRRAAAVAAAKTAKGAVDTTVTVGKVAATAAKVAAATTSAIKGIVSGIVAIASSTPALIVTAVVAIVVVIVIVLISWLPGFISSQERDYPDGVLVGTEGWVSPVPKGTTFVSSFGYRPSFCTPGGCTHTMHRGIDLAQGCGAPIRAAADGVVRSAGPNGAFGNAVVLDHDDAGNAVTTIYAHMQWGSLLVAPGQVVQAGTVLGLEGTTGRSRGCHLHYEVSVNGVFVDPRAFMAARGIQY